MKPSLYFFLGVFGAIALSWAAIVVGSHRQLRALGTHFDPLDNMSVPAAMSGQAAQGQRVYQELGCGACHTQQVRRYGYGWDQNRGWGERQSVARDYALQTHPQLGQARIGPDLANFGERAVKAGVDRAKLYRMLHDGQGGMPAFSFLFERRAIVGQKSSAALALPVAPGWQVVPTSRAEALVSYLLALKQDYALPEAPAAVIPAAVPATPAPAASTAPAATAPAKTP
ncbi:MAG: cbb3-type cytochrome c oxidase subunit II [Opitutae bacterium]|nr:cbb3-type cytochrome c oxidase subunit II [Opitutae bacterium]